MAPMVALNGTSVNGSWGAPATRSHETDTSRAIQMLPLVRRHRDPAHEVAAVNPWPAPALHKPEEQLAWLEAEVVAARERADAANDRAAARRAQVRAALHAELVASRDVVAEMERAHEMTIAMVRAAAETEVERILAGARQLTVGQPARAIGRGPSEVNDVE